MAEQSPAQRRWSETEQKFSVVDTNYDSIDNLWYQEPLVPGAAVAWARIVVIVASKGISDSSCGATTAFL